MHDTRYLCLIKQYGRFQLIALADFLPLLKNNQLNFLVLTTRNFVVSVR